jgi:hypothetical protein
MEREAAQELEISLILSDDKAEAAGRAFRRGGYPPIRRMQLD